MGILRSLIITVHSSEKSSIIKASTNMYDTSLSLSLRGISLKEREKEKHIPCMKLNAVMILSPYHCLPLFFGYLTVSM